MEESDCADRDRVHVVAYRSWAASSWPHGVRLAITTGLTLARLAIDRGERCSVSLLVLAGVLVHSRHGRARAPFPGWLVIPLDLVACGEAVAPIRHNNPVPGDGRIRRCAIRGCVAPAASCTQRGHSHR